MSILDAIGDWITHLVQGAIQGSQEYVDPADDATDDDEGEIYYTTQIIYGTPLRDHKYVLVEEMKDFYTDEEMNTGYHTAEEYKKANKKYGYIYKQVKFDNADTVNKLFDYTKDWIKNNYHSGLTSFDVTALDMRVLGEKVDPFTVGDRVKVNYPDPDTMKEESKTLTVISAEYDLNNPEKNRYKIGIPDIAFDKVYGEAAKSGGGGGGGGGPKPDDDTDNDSELETTTDDLTALDAEWEENKWNYMIKRLKEDGLAGILTAAQEDPTKDFMAILRADYFKTGQVDATTVNAPNLKGNKLTLGGVTLDASKLGQLLELLQGEQ